MHLQLFHTNHFFIRSVTKSNRPHNICSYASSQKKERYYHCLVVFTSIEREDDENTCESAAAEIIRIFNAIKSSAKCNQLAVIPYSHQASVETDARKAFPLLKLVFDKVSVGLSGMNVFFGDFGFNNEWEINVKPHRLSCLYRKI